MITLFRKIRQKLIDSGSVTKYLLYAVGEILLVVIGILIALQVNNWNEERNKQLLKNEYAVSMIEDLKMDLQGIEEAQLYTAEQLGQLDSLSRVIQNSAFTIRQLTQLNLDPNLLLLSDLNNSTFNALINSGSIDLFQKEIRDELIRHQGVQENYLNSTELNNQLYSQTLNSILQNAPIYSDAWLTDEITEQVWEMIDLSQVAISVNALLLQKQFILTSYRQRYMNLKQSTRDILNLLENEIE